MILGIDPDQFWAWTALCQTVGRKLLVDETRALLSALWHSIHPGCTLVRFVGLLHKLGLAWMWWQLRAFLTSLLGWEVNVQAASAAFLKVSGVAPVSPVDPLNHLIVSKLEVNFFTHLLTLLVLLNSPAGDAVAFAILAGRLECIRIGRSLQHVKIAPNLLGSRVIHLAVLLTALNFADKDIELF